MLCGGNLVPPFPKRRDYVKKVEDRWFRLYGKICLWVIESKYVNYRPAMFEKNVDFDSSKSSENAATDMSTSEGGVENENILLQCNEEVHTGRTFATFFCVYRPLTLLRP